ncbi:MAG TPA: hypothetical protein VGC55_01355, partial [Dokdonella sp.]
MADAARSAQAQSRDGRLRSGLRRSGTFCSSALAVALLVFCGGAPAASGVIRTPAPHLHIGGSANAAPARGALGVDVAPQLYRQLASGGRRDFAIEFRERADLSAAR